MKRLVVGGAMLGMLAGLGLGCGGKGKQQVTLKPQEFYAARAAGRAATTQPAAAAPASAEASPAGASNGASSSSSGAAPIVAMSANTEMPAASAGSDTANGLGAVAMRTGVGPGVSASSGSYMIIGTIIASANAQPIYADKVLTKIDAELAERAKDRDPRQFRIAATNVIRDAVKLEIQNELEVAAAQRNVTDDDEQMASALTTRWRQTEITKAGGSLAVARRKSLDEDGIGFDDKVKEKFRWYLVMLYYEKHIFPRVQVSADDMRVYYDRHIDQYTEKAAVLYRVIKIAYRNDAYDKKRALEKAQGLLERAKRGENFADLATGFNDDRTLAKQHGFFMVEKDADGKIKGGKWFNRGDLMWTELEKAVFAIDKGQVTDIVDEKDGYYIAKLEDKKPGVVHSFEEIAVQEKIREKLTADQRMQLRLKEQAKLMKASIWSIDEHNLQTAVDMAMQKYALWERK